MEISIILNVTDDTKFLVLQNTTTFQIYIKLYRY